MAKSIKKKRFCKLSHDMIEGDLDTYVALVSEPRFMCRRCFRVSAEKQNLCKPEKLKLKKKA